MNEQEKIEFDELKMVGWTIDLFSVENYQGRLLIGYDSSGKGGVYDKWVPTEGKEALELARKIVRHYNAAMMEVR